jgi:FKBP-type peptidyl-prolyl cis-trans isomerase
MNLMPTIAGIQNVLSKSVEVHKLQDLQQQNTIIQQQQLAVQAQQLATQRLAQVQMLQPAAEEIFRQKEQEKAKYYDDDKGEKNPSPKRAKVNIEPTDDEHSVDIRI